MAAILVLLDRPDCLPCEYLAGQKKTEPICPDTVLPDKSRLFQLTQFNAQHHEMAHAIGLSKGPKDMLPAKYGSNGLDRVRRSLFGETRSDLYAALRTVATFGQEGLEFERAKASLREYEASIGGYQSDFFYVGGHTHNSSAILKQLLDKTPLPTLIAIGKNPRQAFDLADQLARSPAAENDLLLGELLAGGDKAAQAQKRFNETAKNSGTRTEIQMVKTYKLNPLRSPSQRNIDHQILDISDIDIGKPDQIENLARLKNTLLPAECRTPTKSPLQPK